MDPVASASNVDARQGMPVPPLSPSNVEVQAASAPTALAPSDPDASMEVFHETPAASASNVDARQGPQVALPASSSNVEVQVARGSPVLVHAPPACHEPPRV